MAVYKATYCYPFLNAVDPRSVITKEGKRTAQYVTCKVDTSNTAVTGYKIRILDENNNIIFPLDGNDKISPIAELKSVGDNSAGLNSGLNGTYLKIPLFQNYENPILENRIASSVTTTYLRSYNVLYYTGYCNVDLMLYGPTSPTWSYADDVWSASYSISGTPVLIDGEAPMEGQIVAVKDTTAGGHSGLFKVSIASTETTVTLSLSLATEYSIPTANSLITVLYGSQYHNHIFNRSLTDVTSAHPNMWCDYQGNSGLIDNFNINNSNYKWEITLYQGDATLDQPEGATDIYYMDYSNLDNKWFDMKLTSGTILGSTPKRIQIADANETEIPSSTSADPLILQTRYMQFVSGSSSPNEMGNRVYVKTYDATYGHAYPLEDSLDSKMVDDASGVRFYKHSNNPEDILNTDIVDYGYDSVTHIIVDNTASVTSTRIYITEGFNDDIVNFIMANEDSIPLGTTFLITNAYTSLGDPAPARNGVYTLTEKTEISGNKAYMLTRSASYTTWASYIGKVIYCSAGSLRGQNIESLANAGTFTLWNPKSTSGVNGDSPLFFTSEQPILLFGNKLSKTFSFYVDVDASTSTTTTIPSGLIDSVNPQVGELVLCKNKCWASVAEPLTSSTITLSVATQIADNLYVYVTQGKNFGHKVYKTGSIVNSTTREPNPNYDLYTAKVLKNGTEWTYVSPYIGLKKGMKLKLLNNKEVEFTDNSSSSWLDVYDFNDVVWKIKCSLNLTNAIPSYDNTDTDIPWKYEVRSFYRASDENPFLCCESPYIKLSINGQLYTQFKVRDESMLSSSGFNVYDQNYIDSIKNLETITKFNNRSITLGGEYVQHQNVSWESYRWLLLNDQEEILQDTGKRYDKTIQTTFYGIANDSTQTKNYYAVLYVEDDINNVLQYTIKIKIDPSAINENLMLPFTAIYDCATHAVELTYIDNAMINPSYNMTGEGIYDSTYVNDNETVKNVFDDSIFCAQDAWVLSDTRKSGWLNITGPQRSKKYPINIRNLNNDGINYVFSSDPAYGDIDYTPSKGIDLGANYNAYFVQGKFDNEQGWETSNTDQELSIPGNEFYFVTRFSLDDNFCGRCVAVNVEGTYNAAHNNPTLDINGDTSAGKDLNGYLTFAIELPDNFTGNALNLSRLHFAFKLYKDMYNSESAGEKSDVILSAFADTPAHSYYYVQPKNAIPALTSATANNEFLHYSLDKDYWFQYREEGNKYLSCINKFLGNCCVLVPGDDIQYSSAQAQSGATFQYPVNSRYIGCPLYWIDQRAYLKTTNSCTDKFPSGGDQNFAMHYIDSEHQSQSWPDSTTEGHSYWIEDSHITECDSKTWDEVVEQGSAINIVEFESVARHPNQLSQKEYRVEFEINDVGNIYSQWDNIDFTNSPPPSSVPCYGKIILSKYNSLKSGSENNKFDVLNTIYIKRVGE